MQRAAFVVSLVLNLVLGWLYFRGTSPSVSPSAPTQARESRVAELATQHRERLESLKSYMLNEMKLSQSQVDQFSAIQEEFGRKAQKVFGGPHPPDGGGAFRQVSAERERKIVALLGERGYATVLWWMSGEKDRKTLDEWLKQRQARIRPSPSPSR